MRLLTRYVLLEFIKVFVVSLTALTGVIMLFGVVREANAQGLGPAQVVRLLPYLVPDSLRFTLPGTVLFAASMVFGRMSSSNEITASKSLGISPMIFLWPVYVLACALSLGAVWINDLAVSWGQTGVQRVVLESVEEIAYSMLRSQRSYTSKQFSIIVKGVEGRKLIQPVFTFEARGDNPAVTLQVEEAELTADAKAGTLTISCRNGTLDVQGQASVTFADTYERTISLEDASKGNVRTAIPALMPLAKIRQTLGDEKREVAELKYELALRAAFQMAEGDLTSMAGGNWPGQLKILQDRYNHLCRLRTEPFRRWANGFSCLCFALVGAPVAVRLRNADFLSSFFIVFLPILLVYYPLMALGVDGAKEGVLPPYSVWLGNVILTVIGIWQIRRVLRY